VTAVAAADDVVGVVVVVVGDVLVVGEVDGDVRDTDVEVLGPAVVAGSS
jgi:hypothetical protein